MPPRPSIRVRSFSAENTMNSVMQKYVLRGSGGSAGRIAAFSLAGRSTPGVSSAGLTVPHDHDDSPDEATRMDQGETRLGPGPSAASSSAPTSSSGWLTSSAAIDHGRFPPGTLLGGRYR